MLKEKKERKRRTAENLKRPLRTFGEEALASDAQGTAERQARAYIGSENVP